MRLNQLTPLGVLRRKSLNEALSLLGRQMSADIDATGNIMAVDAVLRKTGFFANLMGQTLVISHGGGIYVVVDKEVHDGYNGPWTEDMEVSLVRSGSFAIQTGEITFTSKAGGEFGSQPCKVKLNLTLKIKGETRYVRRALDEEKLEEYLKKDVLVVAETFEAWFGQQTVEEIIAKQEAGDIPNVMNLELSDYDHEWTFHVTAAEIASLSHSKVVNEGLAKIKQKQQARAAALHAIANGISKILPGRPTALKAILEAIAAENRNGNIVAEEAAAFAAQAQEAEDKRLQDEAADKAAKAEGKLAAQIAVADDPEKFASLHTAIGDVVDIIGDQKALQLSGEAKVAFGTWFRVQVKSAQVPDDFNRLDALVREYAAYLAEEDAQQLPQIIEVEFTLKKEAAERRQAQRLAAKTSGIASGAEGLAAIIKNPPPDVLAIADALETNRALVAAAHLAQHTDQSERMVRAYTQGQLAGHNGAVPALPALGNIDALLGQEAPSEQEQIDALLLQIRNEAPVVKTGKR